MAKTSQFAYSAEFSCSREELYNWHSREGALDRLIPPWEKTTVVDKKGGIQVGGEVVMKMHAGPFPFTWIAHHVEEKPPVIFRDIMHKGPFASWSHSHVFEETNNGSLLHDRIEYALPFQSILPAALKKHVDTTLRRTFQHRKKVLLADLELHKKYGMKPQKVLISGASGVLGKALTPLLTTGGHEVWSLVRRRPNRQKRELFWDPVAGEIEDLPYFDCVIHLAGEYIGVGRWTDEKKRRVIDSRVDGTTLLAEKIASLSTPPKSFLSASAVGYYGDSGSEVVHEESPKGNDFISDVCDVWEKAAEPASRAGIRTVLLRIGIALSTRGGALQRLLSTRPFGLIRRFGNGEQYISWISIDDTISAIYHAMGCKELSGAVNICAPHPLTNTAFMQKLSKITGSPLMLAVPVALLKGMYGQMALEILLSGCNAGCQKLIDSGFTFRHLTLEDALTDLLGEFALEEVAFEGAIK